MSKRPDEDPGLSSLRQLLCGGVNLVDENAHPVRSRISERRLGDSTSARPADDEIRLSDSTYEQKARKTLVRNEDSPGYFDFADYDDRRLR
jgi:hypothetical protein